MSRAREGDDSAAERGVPSPTARPRLARSALGTLTLPSRPAGAAGSGWVGGVGQLPHGEAEGRGCLGRLRGGSLRSRLPAVPYAHPNGPLKPSRQLISTTWNAFVANLWTRRGRGRGKASEWQPSQGTSVHPGLGDKHSVVPRSQAMGPPVSVGREKAAGRRLHLW